MARLYKRVWAFEMGKIDRPGTRYEGLDIRFSSRQNGGSKPTLCDLTIFNPDDNILSLLEKDTLVRVFAGYEEEGPVEVAQGTIVYDTIENQFKSQEPRVSFQISKGRQIFTNATLSKSWSSVGAEEILEYIRQQLGVSFDVVKLAQKPYYGRGFSLSGSPSQALATIVRDCGCQYTLVDGRLRIWPLNEHAKILVDIWSEDTGLLSARQKSQLNKTQISAVALLRPGLRPGDVVQLECPQFNGQVTALEVSHDGDTKSDTWNTTMVGIPYGR